MAFLAQVIFGVFDGLPVLCLAGLLVRAGSDRAMAAYWDGQQWQAVRGFEWADKTTSAPGRLGAPLLNKEGLCNQG